MIQESRVIQYWTLSVSSSNTSLHIPQCSFTTSQLVACFCFDFLVLAALMAPPYFCSLLQFWGVQASFLLHMMVKGLLLLNLRQPWLNVSLYIITVEGGELATTPAVERVDKDFFSSKVMTCMYRILYVWQKVANNFLDPSCNKYWNLIGQSRWYKSHITLVNSHIPPVNSMLWAWG